MKNRLVIFLSAIFVLFTFGSVSAAPEQIQCLNGFSPLPDGLGCYLGYEENIDFSIYWLTKPKDYNFHMVLQPERIPQEYVCQDDLQIFWAGGAILCFVDLPDGLILIQADEFTGILGTIPPVILNHATKENDLQFVANGRFYNSFDGLTPYLHEANNGTVTGTAKFMTNYWGRLFLAIEDDNGNRKFVPIFLNHLSDEVLNSLRGLNTYIFWGGSGKWLQPPPISIPGELAV